MEEECCEFERFGANRHAVREEVGSRFSKREVVRNSKFE